MLAIFSLPRSGSTMLQSILSVGKDYQFESTPRKCDVGKWVRPNQMEDALKFNPRVIILCRDIRDIILSYVRHCEITGQNIQVIEDRIPIESENLVRLYNELDCTLVRYEDICIKGVEWLSCYLDVPCNDDMTLFTNCPWQRDHEIERHGDHITQKSIGRYKIESTDFSNRIAGMCSNYQETFGYEV